MRQLVFVHGRAQEFKDAATLKAEWLGALCNGLAKSGLELPIPDTEVRFPYYGQTLYDLATSAKQVAEVIIKGANADAEEQVFLRSVVEEVRNEIGISDADVVVEAGLEVVEKGPLNWGFVQAALRLIDKHVPGTSVILALFTYDVYRYLGNPGIQDKIETEIRKTIQRDVPTIVVGHSLGSVISYRLLGREGDMNGWNVPLYVTVGSPLAIKAIKRRLTPISYPKCVGTWFNARDKMDVVALYPLDYSHFPVDPNIENNDDVQNPTGCGHGGAGYLEDQEVSRRIHEALLQ